MITLGGINLAVHSFTEGVYSGSNVAYKGIWDMPSRIGKTFQSWAGRDGIQPYVNASEIRFGGRDISVIGFIEGTDLKDCIVKAYGLFALIDSFTALVPLVCDWGTYIVYVNAPIQFDYTADQGLMVELKFREPVVDLTGVAPVEANPDNDFGIDGISFTDLGGVMLELWGDRVTRPAPKAQQYTSYQTEGYQITKTEAPILNFRLLIIAPDYIHFKAKIQTLCALFSSPGLRSFILPDDALRSFFVKDGFKTDQVYRQGEQFSGVVEAKLTQVGDTSLNWGYLTDSLGNNIIDKSHNKIIVRL